MDIKKAISEAKCCSARIARDYAVAATYGNDTDELFYGLLKVNAFVRTLERNVKRVYYEKEKIPFENQTVTFSMLKKKNSFLTLEASDKFLCVKKETDPCLSDPEICLIIEQVRLLCSTLNCNCK